MGKYPRHAQNPFRNIPVFDENRNIQESLESGLFRYPTPEYPMTFTRFDPSVRCVRGGPAGTSAGGAGGGPRMASPTKTAGGSEIDVFSAHAGKTGKRREVAHIRHTT